MRDIMCSGYVAGGNTKFFGCKPENKRAGPSWEDKVRAMEHRLSFADDASGEYDSMLAFACPWQDGARRDQVISLSSRLLPWEVARSSGVDPNAVQKDYFPGKAAGFKFYGDRLNLGQIHFGEDIRAAENQEFIAQGSVNNAMCFIGPHRVYSPWSSTFAELVPGQGHFGPDALPGVSLRRRRPPPLPHLDATCTHPVHPRETGRAVAARRVGVAGAVPQLDDGLGGGRPLPIGVPAGGAIGVNDETLD